MEYTRGEWGFRGILPIGFHIYNKNTNNPIAVGINNETDARLISATPDLYEACKGFMDNADDIQLTAKQALKLFSFIKGMERAIAKAEGK